MARFHLQNSAKILMIMVLLSACVSMRYKTTSNQESMDHFSQVLKLQDHFQIDFEFANDTISRTKTDHIVMNVRWTNISNKKLFLYPGGELRIQRYILDWQWLINVPFVAKKDEENLHNKILLSPAETYQKTILFSTETLMGYLKNNGPYIFTISYTFPLNVNSFSMTDSEITPFVGMLVSHHPKKLVIAP